MALVTARTLRDFNRNECGAIAVVAGVSLTVILGLMGVALDYGRAASAQRRLAAAADAGALAAAVVPEELRINIARQYFAQNYGAGVQPMVDTANGAVVVTARHHVPTTLAQLFGVSELQINARSEARAATARAAPQCVLLLEKFETGFYVNSDSRLDADCGVHVNSAHSTEALLTNSNGHVAASQVHVHGISRLNSGSTITPLPVDGAPRQADPLLDLAEPTTGTCNFTDFTVNTGQTLTMVPGVYCGNTVVNSGGTATMQPGLYTFRDGEFLINSLSRVSGSEVMMYFHGDNARLNVNSSSTFEATAPRTGAYAGILMFQSRATASIDAPAFTLNSDSTTKIEGTIYLPRGVFVVNSQSTANQSASYTAIVAQRLVLNSFGTLTIRSDFDTATPLPAALQRFRASTVAILVK